MSPRILGLVLATLIALGIGLILHWSVGLPDLAPGDRVETRTCRDCKGSGKEGEATPDPRMPREGPPPGVPGAAGGPCVACGGSGKVQVILPGPNHPNKVRILAGDAKKLPQEEALMVSEMASRQPGHPVPGVLADVKIHLECGDRKLDLATNQAGRCRCALTPGTWKVHAEAAGYKPVDETLEVPVLRDPIYQEKAHIVREEESQIGQSLLLLFTPGP